MLEVFAWLIPGAVLAGLVTLFYRLPRAKRSVPPATRRARGSASRPWRRPDFTWTMFDWTWLPSGVASLVFVFTYQACLSLDKLWSPVGLTRTLLLLLPLAPLAWFIAELYRIQRQGGELEQRIQFEAASITLLTFLSFVAVFELSTEITNSVSLNNRHVWSFLPLYYSLNLWLQKSRYLEVPTKRTDENVD